MVLAAVPMADSNSGGGSGLAIFLPILLIVGMIWFMSRSQRKQRARQADTVARLRPGTRVITTSGQVGIVDEVEDEYVVLEIAPDVYSRFVKHAVGRVLDDPETALEPEPADEATDDGAGDLADDVQETVQDTVPDSVPDEVADAEREKDGPGDKPQTPPTHTEH